MSIEKTPWDEAVFGIPTFEITAPAEESMRLALSKPGHYTIKVDPLADKKLLHDYGCYYCDTLIEPFCTADRFKDFFNEEVSLSPGAALDELHEIGHGAFVHGRFSRDFNLDPELARARYDAWLAQLHREGRVLGIYFRGRLAAFIAISGSSLVLHAVGGEFRGRGLAKYFWSAACRRFFEQGLPEIKSSVSAANLAVLNLYASLGFGFRNALDVYHLLVK